jgi:hypothetical protein
MDTVINILAFSRRHDVDVMRQRVIDGTLQYVHAKRWHGQRVAFNMHFDHANNALIVGGGRRRLPDSTIRFISQDLDYERRHDVNAVQQWASQFSRLVIVADAQELLQDPELRHDVATRRLALQNRYLDVSLMLMDVDGIMDIEDTGDYATTYIGALAAFGSKPYNGSKLKTFYHNQWKEVYSLGLAQDLLCFRRRYSKRPVYLPLMLICHSDKHYQMGFMELLVSCINCAVHSQSLELKNVSTHKTYSTMASFTFNKAFMDRLKSMMNRNVRHIRLAVIGLTSSGKTYLLEDMVTALKKYGYQCSASSAMSTLRPTAATYLNQVANYDDGIWQTEVYACRSTNVYLTVYNKDGQRFIFEFVDVPGDVIKRDSITEFQAILSALSISVAPIFRETVWTRGDGHQIKTIDFVADGPTEPTNVDDTTDDIKLRGKSDSNQPSLTAGQGSGSGLLTQGFRTLSYEKNEVVIKELIKQGYRPLSASTSRNIMNRLTGANHSDASLISGQYLLAHLEDYVTDTVINGILDAWDALGIDQSMSTSGISLTETYDGKLNASDSNKQRFDKVYKNHFFFHYYTFFATDVVICDKCAVPFDHLNYDKDGKPKSKALSAVERAKALDEMTTNYWYMMNALTSLLSHPSAPEKHLYLAFRGVDSFLVQNNFKMLRKLGYSANMLYSLFVLHLFGKFRSDVADEGSIYDDEDNEYDLEGFGSHASFDEPADFWDAIHSTCGDNAAALRLSKKLLDEYLSGQHDKFVNVDPLSCFMTSDMDLRDHILDRIDRFKDLPGACSVPSDPSSFARKLDYLLPPHVYFTSSAIDMDFNICGHSLDSVRLFAGRARHEGNRMCWGTRNLLSDILLAHGIDNDGEVIGQLLAYCYQSTDNC